MIRRFTDLLGKGKGYQDPMGAGQGNWTEDFMKLTPVLLPPSQVSCPPGQPLILDRLLSSVFVNGRTLCCLLGEMERVVDEEGGVGWK